MAARRSYGPRQCGKTTLAQAVGEAKGYAYFSFDDAVTLGAAISDPIAFVGDLPQRAILDAGRMEILRLHPLAQSELGGAESGFLDRLFGGGFKARSYVRLGDELARRIVAGGFQVLNVSDLAAPFQLSRPTIKDYVTLGGGLCPAGVGRGGPAGGPWHLGAVAGDLCGAGTASPGELAG